MNIYALVFSNNKNYRIARHSLFWLMWIAYYTATSTYGMKSSIPLMHRFIYSLVEVSITTPLDMIFIYSIIYFLLPKLLFRGRYISMILLWLLFSIIFLAVFELLTAELNPFLRSKFNLPVYNGPIDYFWLSFSLFSQINMEGCLAAAIKLGKISFINQKEIDLLRNEKARILSEKDKSGLQPVFLADIIGRMEQMSLHKKMNLSKVLKKIRSIMTSIIYESANAKISLDRELQLVKEYIELEQCTREELIDVKLCISGDTGEESIASFIVLQCIQNAFTQLSLSEICDKKLDIQIHVDESILSLLMSWNKPYYTSTLVEGKNGILLNLNNRLKLIYPQSHEFKFFIETEKIIVFMKINLKTAIN